MYSHFRERKIARCRSYYRTCLLALYKKQGLMRSFPNSLDWKYVSFEKYISFLFEFGIHMGTSLLSMKVSASWLKLGTQSHWKFKIFIEPHLLWRWTPVVKVMFKDQKHSHQLMSIWLWNRHFLFDWLRTDPTSCLCL